LLPKIHKPTRPPPGRPIVSACGSITEKISEFVDFHIRKYVELQHSYIRDTQDFLHKILSIPVNEHTILATIDVSSLYTSIPHEEGLESLQKVLIEHNHNHPPIECLVNLARLVLTNNVFRFNETFYLQTQGTAMGTRMAPSYANLFMSVLESDFLDNQPMVPTVWYRFIDDIFLIWDHTEEDFLEFFRVLNNHHRTIKFTMEHSNHEINFLDTTIYIEAGKLQSKLYSKPTDAHLYLRHDSCHPRNTITSIPYSQMLRLQRIHSKPEEAAEAINNLETQFKHRRYPQNILKQCRNKLDTTKEEENKEDTQKLLFITQFDPGLGNLKTVWENNKHILSQHPDTALLATHKFMIAYRRPRNIRDILVKTDMKTNNNKAGSYPCRKFKCQTCRLMSSGNTFKSSITGKTYNIIGRFDCTSSYLIYLITCKKCLIQYVGQTSTTLNSRLSAHRHDIRHQLDKPISKHFSYEKKSDRHNMTHFMTTVIDVGPYDVTSRLLRETSWIRQLVTMEPHGLNIQTTV
jgi:hypothetical protein